MPHFFYILLIYNNNHKCIQKIYYTKTKQRCKKMHIIKEQIQKIHHISKSDHTPSFFISHCLSCTSKLGYIEHLFVPWEAFPILTAQSVVPLCSTSQGSLVMALVLIQQSVFVWINSFRGDVKPYKQAYNNSYR